MAAIGASFPFPLASAEVGRLNGHRPFSLGGGNGSKCAETDKSRLSFAAFKPWSRRRSDAAMS
jgi:hypothetical protein